MHYLSLSDRGRETGTVYIAVGLHSKSIAAEQRLKVIAADIVKIFRTVRAEMSKVTVGPCKSMFFCMIHATVRIAFGKFGKRLLPVPVEAENVNSTSESLGGLVVRQNAFFHESLLRYGAILFRGFGVSSVDEFERAVRSFSKTEPQSYAGGVSPRSLLASGVYTSTEYPADLQLALHNELSYSQIYPKQLYFFCVAAASEGGETTIADSRRILRRMPPEVADLLKERNVLYIRNLSENGEPGYSWHHAFETDVRDRVEDRCTDIGARFEWQKDGSLRLSQIGPATTVHSVTGEEVWFNQAHGFHPSELGPSVQRAITESGGQFRLESYFGDHSPIPLEILNKIREILQDETVKIKWQRGDVLILDNILTAHGRMPFIGPRKIALAMT